MIYCLEDDKGIRELMVYTLQIAGFEAQGFPESGAFWEALQRELPQLVVLDIMLPGEDGISVLRRLRNAPETAQLPVIMASARGSEYDRVIGLDLGADDYLSKPFGMMEMVSRIRAVLRRSQGQDAQDVLAAGEIRLDRARHTVSAAGQEVALTLKEYELLRILMENPGIVFSRDRLLQTVWDMNFSGGTRTVDVHIATLRTKLGGSGDRIQTVRGVGYRLV
ncbi:MAG: response regulator transcription factor [Lachnospiraceae bacterium]|nr:response regulator transcription factor [Lachnospiraceae bacterium]